MKTKQKLSRQDWTLREPGWGVVSWAGAQSPLKLTLRVLGGTLSIGHTGRERPGCDCHWHCGRNTKFPLLPGTPSSLPRCKEGVPLDIRVVLGCPGSGKAGSQPEDLGGETGALGSIGEHQRWQGAERAGLGAGWGIWTVGPRGGWTQTLGHNLGVCTQKWFSPNEGWAEPV